MRRDLNRPSVAWGINIAQSDMQALSSLVPIYGAKSWFMVEGLRAFLNLMENPGSASLRHWVHQRVQIEPALREPTAELSVQIPTELYLRFGKLFPEMGAATWFTRRYIRFLVADLRLEQNLEERVENTVNRAMTPEPEPAEIETVHMGPDE